MHDVADDFDALYQILWPNPDFIYSPEYSSHHPSSCLGLCLGGTPPKTREDRTCRLRISLGGVEGTGAFWGVCGETGWGRGSRCSSCSPGILFDLCRSPVKLTFISGDFVFLKYF